MTSDEKTTRRAQARKELATLEAQLFAMHAELSKELHETEEVTSN
jgi:hypothetical protein